MRRVTPARSVTAVTVTRVRSPVASISSARAWRSARRVRTLRRSVLGGAGGAATASLRAWCMHAFRRGLAALFHSLRSIAHLVQHPLQDARGSSKTTRSSLKRCGDGTSGRRPWPTAAQICVPLEGVSRQARSTKPMRSLLRSTGRRFSAQGHPGLRLRRFSFHWKALLRKKR